MVGKSSVSWCISLISLFFVRVVNGPSVVARLLSITCVRVVPIFGFVFFVNQSPPGKNSFCRRRVLSFSDAFRPHPPTPVLPVWTPPSFVYVTYPLVPFPGGGLALPHQDPFAPFRRVPPTKPQFLSPPHTGPASRGVKKRGSKDKDKKSAPRALMHLAPHLLYRPPLPGPGPPLCKKMRKNTHKQTKHLSKKNGRRRSGTPTTPCFLLLSLRSVLPVPRALSSLP